MVKENSFSNGKFVISLDFELIWGVRDKKSILDYGKNIKNVHTAIPVMLELFKRYNISVTFSTVGFLFANDKNELIKSIPLILPQYNDTNLSPYNDITNIGEGEYDDPWHYGFSLVQSIIKEGIHEIGTHTFSHFYCLEPGPSLESFRQDLVAAKELAKHKGIVLKSIVFPRNQYNKNHIEVCEEEGIECFRGNPESWLYHSRNKNDETLVRRLFRFLDAYFNLSGHNCYTKNFIGTNGILNIAGSRFLRPYSKKLSVVNNLKLKRITNSMSFAAKNNMMYHLWWHPHNFGSQLDENIYFLEKILKHFSELRTKYSFESLTMAKLAEQIKKSHE